MPNRDISVVVAHDAGLSGSWVAGHIPADVGITVFAVANTLSPASEQVLSSDADMLVVACGDQYEEALELVEWWVGHRAGHPVVVLCHNSANGFVKRAFDAGADDLVVLEGGGEISGESSQQLVF